MELISIIVPIYNVSKYLDKCISSIIKQTYKKMDIILIDDGSTDDSSELCDKYQKRDNRIRVVHKSNEGLIQARKDGIKLANGNYIMYIDGDDFIDSNYVENMMLYTETKAYDLVWDVCYYRMYEKKKIVSGLKNYPKIELEKDIIQNILSDMVYGRRGYTNAISFSLCEKIFKKNFLLPIINSVSSQITMEEDFSCMIRALSLNPSIKFVRECGYYYVQRGSSMIHNYRSEKDMLVMLLDTLNFFDENDVKDDKLYDTVKNTYTRFLIFSVGLDYLQQDNKRRIYPFENLYKRNRVIIYGVGNLGDRIIDYVFESQNLELIGFIDKRYSLGDCYRGLPFIPLNKIDNMKIDCVVVSVIKSDSADEIKKELLDIGIDANQIAIINDSLCIEYANNVLKSVDNDVHKDFLKK